MWDLTVLVVDRDPRARAQVVSALRAIGLHALGAHVPIDALLLLDGIAADVVLVRGGDGDGALAYLRSRTLLVQVPQSATPDEAVRVLVDAVSPAPSTRLN